jgi:hypothetical protein
MNFAKKEILKNKHLGTCFLIMNEKRLISTGTFNYSVGKQNTILLVLCFAIHYLIFFFIPHLYPKHVFFNYELVPPGKILGMDYIETLKIGKEPLAIAYSPFADIFFTMLSELPFTQGFLFITLITLGSLFISQFLILKTFLLKNLNPMYYFILLFFSLTSYPFMFEIERGQWNIISIALIVAAVYFVNKYWYLPAAICIAFATSLKIFPLIFASLILIFRPNFKHFISFTLITGASLVFFFFVKGISYFKWFTRWLSHYSDIKGTWIGNHSIKSFVLQTQQEWLSTFLLVLVILIFLIGCYLAFNQQKSDFSLHFLSILCIISCAIPNVSHDYKISILILFVPLMISKRINTIGYGLAESIVLFSIVFLYIFLLTPYSATFYLAKTWLNCKLPALLLLSIFLLIDGYLMFKQAKSQNVDYQKLNL